VWLAGAIISARLVVLVVNFLAFPNFNWREIIDLRHVSFLGEQVSVVGDAAVRSWQWLPAASLAAALAYLSDAALQAWRKGEPESRRRALVVGVAVVLPMLIAIVLAESVVMGLVHLPVLGTPPFLIMLAVMALELNREVIRSGRAQLELAKLRANLAQVERVTALGQLASALAHELIQPLTSILANAEALEAELETGRLDRNGLRAVTADIRAQAVRAAEMIRGMRGLIKRRSLVRQPLMLHELVQDVLLLVRSEALSRQVVLECSLESALPGVQGDRLHLSQVMLNLVINALDAVQSCPPHARRVVIEARAEAAGGVTMTVSDSGPGVPAWLIDKVFDPLFTTKTAGTGMGLAISRFIIEAHGGRLWAEPSREGGGATFRFTLPAGAPRRNWNGSRSKAA